MPYRKIEGMEKASQRGDKNLMASLVSDVFETLENQHLWRYNNYRVDMRCYQGERWDEESTVRKDKPRFSINIFRPLIEHSAAIVSDNCPRLRMVPFEPGDQQMADAVNNYVRFRQFTDDFQGKYVQGNKNQFLHGNGVLKIPWNPVSIDGLGNLGDIEILNLPPHNVLTDELVTGQDNITILAQTALLPRSYVSRYWGVDISLLPEAPRHDNFIKYVLNIIKSGSVVPSSGVTRVVELWYMDPTVKHKTVSFPVKLESPGRDEDLEYASKDENPVLLTGKKRVKARLVENHDIHLAAHTELLGTLAKAQEQEMTGIDVEGATKRIQEHLDEHTDLRGKPKEEIVERRVPVPKYPYGRRTTACVGTGAIFLDDRPNPFEDGMWPYVFLTNSSAPSAMWGDSIPKMIYELGRHADKAICLLTEVLMKTAYPDLVLPKDCKISTQAYLNRPARILHPPTWMAAQGIKWNLSPRIGPELPNYINILIKLADFVVGTSEVSRGTKPGGKVSGILASALQEASNLRIRMGNRLNANSLRKMGKMLYSRLCQYVPFEVTKRILGHHNKPELITFNPGMIRGYDVLVDDGVISGQERMQNFQLMDYLTQKFGLHPKHLINMTDLPNKSELIKEAEEQMKIRAVMAEAEARKLAAGVNEFNVNEKQQAEQMKLLQGGGMQQ